MCRIGDVRGTSAETPKAESERAVDIDATGQDHRHLPNAHVKGVALRESFQRKRPKKGGEQWTCRGEISFW